MSQSESSVGGSAAEAAERLLGPSPTRPTAPPSRPGGERRRFRDWPRTGRWLTYVAVLLVLALVAGLVLAVLTVRRPFPTVSGEITVPGLDSEVDVLRDEYGIAQVYADTAHDLFYAQGYVHAQDRFFEMDFRRHLTAGRLSELLGREALKTDKYVRTMGWRRVAERELSLLEPDTIRYLEAYSDGVNAYIGSADPDEMSLEYSVLALDGLDYRPEAWTPADSVAWLKALAWDLRGNMEEEIDRALASTKLTPAEVEFLYPPYPFPRHRPIVHQASAAVEPVASSRSAEEQSARDPTSRTPAGPTPSRQIVAALERTDRGLDAMPELVGSGAGIGSNGWVVAGERSSTGEPILANDPHMDVSMPGVWYPMGLHCRELTASCPFDVSGFTFSGLPGVVIGHNQDIAWGVTNLGPDVVDLFLERVDGDRYRYDGRMRRLETREETIVVAGEPEPVTFQVRSTRHGPLVSDVSGQLSTVAANEQAAARSSARGEGYAVALSWTALTPARTADAIFMMDRATDWGDFRAAARRFAAPSQNLLYADRAGHIGYQAPGRIPIRKPGSSGDYPVEGWRPENDWTGRFIPFRALPRVLDPNDGVIVTANQAVTGEAYPYYLTDTWAYGYRSDRIHELLRGRVRLGVDDMAAIQLDDRDAFAPIFVPYLLDILLPSQYLSGGQRLLQNWRFRHDAGSAAAAYYNAVWRQTLALTFRDQLPEAAWPEGGDRWFEVMRRLLASPNSPWWDDLATKAVVETRDEILYAALVRARDELVRLQARRTADWTWGHHHRMDLQHQSLGRSDVGLVRWLFNRGGYQVGGSGDLVNATKWNAARDYRVTAAPSMRMVVSLADFDDSRWVNLTGVSGHAFHANYVDQTELWVEGGTLPWYSSRARIEESAEDVLTLVPSAAGGVLSR